MNEALYGAPKLMGMAICLESERNAAIARAERAEAAANDCRRVVAAIPWRSLASIYAHPGVVLDADADAIGEFLDQYADAWAGGFAPSDLGPITQESLLPDVMPPLGRRTIEIMERKIAPSDNDLLSPGTEAGAA